MTITITLPRTSPWENPHDTLRALASLATGLAVPLVADLVPGASTALCVARLLGIRVSFDLAP